MNEWWNPKLEDYRGALHSRLVRAMQRDIEHGLLLPEEKLPPHRVLAQRLGIGIGTVTRAYTEAERIGLVTSAIGRGTFVASFRHSPEPESGPIDLSLNVQTLDSVTGMLREALEQASARVDLNLYANYSSHAGFDAHRQAIAEWLRQSAHFPTADWRNLAITTGSQHAMALALDELCRPGDTILTEAATFSGLLALAHYRNLQVEGVAMDQEGIIPEALEEAVRKFRSNVVYLQPTLHNPTTRTMSRARREAIADLARKLDISILEDDVYAPIAYASSGSPTHLHPLAMLAPERVWYSTSVSKSLVPGLRVGAVIAPTGRDFERLLMGIRANCYATPSLPALIVSQWIKDGTALKMLDVAAREAEARLRIASRMLGNSMEQPSYETCLHAWLPMNELEAERFASTSLRRGVHLTPPSSIVVDGTLASGVRICLNNVSRPRLEHALRIVQSVIADHAQAVHKSVV